MIIMIQLTITQIAQIKRVLKDLYESIPIGICIITAFYSCMYFNALTVIELWGFVGIDIGSFLLIYITSGYFLPKILDKNGNINELVYLQIEQKIRNEYLK
jgi:hypothetical protein